MREFTGALRLNSKLHGASPAQTTVTGQGPPNSRDRLGLAVLVRADARQFAADKEEHARIPACQCTRHAVDKPRHKLSPPAADALQKPLVQCKVIQAQELLAMREARRLRDAYRALGTGQSSEDPLQGRVLRFWMAHEKAESSRVMPSAAAVRRCG
jgi:hypothetical protein